MFQLRIIVFVCLNFLSSALNLCPESISTVSIVSHCPNSASEWTSAAIRKSCEDMGKVQTCTKSDNFAYHCVLNKEATMLIEVCAPVHFMNGYCARFSEVDKRILNDPGLDCTKFNPPCPPRFPSNESYKYQTCYKIAGEHLEVNPKFDQQKSESIPILSIVFLAIFVCILIILLTIVFLGYKFGWIHLNCPRRHNEESKGLGRGLSEEENNLRKNAEPLLE